MTKEQEMEKQERTDNFLRDVAMWERQAKNGIEEAMLHLSAFEAMCEMPDTFLEKNWIKRTHELYVEKQLRYLESCGLVELKMKNGKMMVKRTKIGEEIAKEMGIE